MPYPCACSTSSYIVSRMPQRSAPPLFIVFNAALDGDDARAAHAHLSARLHQAQRAHQVFWAERPGDLAIAAVRAVQAAREAAGIVVAAGSDTTLHTVAQAVWNARLPLGKLPVGAGPFSFSQTHGLPTDLDAAITALLQAQVQPLTIGLLGERPFLVSASVGLHACLPVARETLHARTRRRLATTGSNLLALLRGRSLLTLELHANGASTVVRTRTLRISVTSWAAPPSPSPISSGLHANTHAPEHTFLSDTQDAPAPGKLPPPSDVPVTSATATSFAPHRAPPFPSGHLYATTLPTQSWWHALWRVLRGKTGQVTHRADADHFIFEQLIVRPYKPGRLHRADSVRVTLDGHTSHLPMPLTFTAAPHPLAALLPPAEAGINNPATCPLPPNAA